MPGETYVAIVEVLKTKAIPVEAAGATDASATAREIAREEYGQDAQVKYIAEPAADLFDGTGNTEYAEERTDADTD